MNKFLPKFPQLQQSDQRLMGYSIFVAILCLLNLVINNINNKFSVSDFKVYYYAAQNLLDGGQVYFIAYGLGTGIFKYSPMNLLIFLPYTLFSFKMAAIIHFCLLSFCYWYSYLLVYRLLEKYFFGMIEKVSLTLSLAVIGTMIFLVKELYLGNINIILVMLCLMALHKILEGKKWLGGLLLGIVILTKPFFLILVLPLIFRKELKALLGMTMTVVTGFVLPFLILGFHRAFTLHKDWFTAVLMHGSDYPSKNSIEYLLRHHFFPTMPGYFDYLIILTACFIILAFVINNLSGEEKEKFNSDQSSRNRIFEWFLIMAILPNIVRTDTEHFLASIPVITYIVFSIRCKKIYWLIPLFVVLLFFFGGNSEDLLGKKLSDGLFNMGLIGFSNLLIAGLGYIIFKETNFTRKS